MESTDREKREKEGTLNQPPQMSPMKPVTHDAYGGGMYGYEADQDRNQPENQTKKKPAASDSQSADGPVDGPTVEPKHKPPPSTGDRDVDITGQSYIQ